MVAHRSRRSCAPQAEIVQRVTAEAPDLRSVIAATAVGLQYLEREVTGTKRVDDYVLMRKRKRWLRPVRRDLFIPPAQWAAFKHAGDRLVDGLRGFSGRPLTVEEGRLVDQVVYTCAQACGCVLDLAAPPSVARKQVGLKFEEIIRHVIAATGVPCQKKSVSVSCGELVYHHEADALVGELALTLAETRRRALLVSCKTTSKDRMSKIFADKFLLDQLLCADVPIVAVFLHDIQRVKQDRVSSTFVPGQFQIYWRCFSPLAGVFYLDPPKQHASLEFSDKIQRFHQLLSRLPELLAREWQRKFGPPILDPTLRSLADGDGSATL